jgi:hypothetical protein
MILLVCRASLLVAFYLLALATSASAERAWVVWTHTLMEKSNSSESNLLVQRARPAMRLPAVTFAC